MTIGSLFSGIGGLELGLEWAELGSVLWQAEKDEFSRRVLARHWPRVDRYHDVREVDGSTPRVDLICGGFPCQDVSSAGKGAGLTGRRSGLWREFARVVEAQRPAWVVVENVASGANRWLDAVVRDLAERGYETLPVPLSASDVGAPHRRARIFVVGRRLANRDSQSSGIEQQRQPARRSSRVRDARTPDASDPGTAVGNAASERRQAGHERHRTPEHALRPAVGHSDGNRREGQPPTRLYDPGQSGADPDRTAIAVRGWPPRRDERDEWARYVADGGPEPGIRRGPDGLPARMEAARNQELRCLGNAVVPQCAEVIGWVIRELEMAA